MNTAVKGSDTTVTNEAKGASPNTKEDDTPDLLYDPILLNMLSEEHELNFTNLIKQINSMTERGLTLSYLKTSSNFPTS